MKRNISVFGLLFMSMSAIIGSGWLFAASYTQTVAGPAAIISWMIGGGMVIIIAFVFAELCTMILIVGASTRIPHYVHGAMTSYVFAWIIWLSYLFYAPTEVQATIQYLAVLFPSLIISNSGALSYKGYALAVIILMMFSIINVVSIRWLIKANSFLTIIKIIIPLFISCLFLGYFCSSTSTIVNSGGAKFVSHGIHGVMGAVSVGGIIFAFNGFKLAAEMAGECKNPKFALPVAIIGSVLLCLIIYLLLQVSFLSAMNSLTKIESINLGPFASLAKAHNMKLLIPVIYAGAIISPIAAGLMYFSCASKSLYGMSQNGYLPKFFGILNRNGNPVYAIITSFAIGLLIFMFFKGWDILASVITVLFALTYAIGPVNLAALRKKIPEMERPVRLPFGYLWSLIALFACSLMIYWCGWRILSIAESIILVGVILLFLFRHFVRKQKKIELNFSRSIWLWIYLAGMSLISYESTFEGKGIISDTTSIILIFILCLFCLYISASYTLPKFEMRKRIKHAIVTDW